MHFFVYVIMEIHWVLHALDLMYFGGQSLHWFNCFVALDLPPKTIQSDVLKAWLGEYHHMRDYITISYLGIEI